MGTLAGNKPAWGDDWGYNRASNRNFGDLVEAVPRQREDAADRAESPEPSNVSALLFCATFWLLLTVAAVLWWAGT
ncbi:MAG TPA: hypothetical protein VE866_16560 [Candidatus Binatia bacterium]|nr:hypothetical protein [Candidatus Binatia bacterium]